VRELETLAGFSDSEPPAVTRIVFSDADRTARTWLKRLFEEAGLAVREDAVGNTFAHWIGSEPDLPAVSTGSHIDAIPSSGKYDGTVGVLGALEAIRSLQRGGFLPRRSVDLIIFTSEEPTRFGIGCLGSRLLSGTLSPEVAATLRDGHGDSLESVRRQAGFEGDLASVRLPANAFSSFVELHIEQGPILEREGFPIGVVTSIAAPATLRVQIEGEGGHAGAVLMSGRKDALLAAAEIALAVEHAARSTHAIDTVATTGICQIFPGAVNSIPSRALLEIDVRDIDRSRRDNVLDQIQQACRLIGARRSVSVQTAVLNADSPAQSDPNIVAALAHAADAAGYKHRHMVSRAYHDSLFMARLAPVAMLFIPCRNGVSHRPDEYSSPEQIAAGVEVLARTLAELASQ
jgi:N-carbamoyl-L-amino-acid hydrolase